MNPELGDAVPLKLIPGFVSVLEIEEDEATICQEGPVSRRARHQHRAQVGSNER